MMIEAIPERPLKENTAPARAFDPARQAYVNGFVSLAKGVLSVAVTVGLTPFLLRYLGASDFGIWSLLGLVINYVMLIDLGTSGAVVKFMGGLSPQDQVERLNEMITSYLMLVIVLAVAVTLLAVLLRGRLGPTLGLFGLSGGDAKLFLFAFVSLYAAGLISNALLYVLFGLHRLDVGNYVGILVLLAQTAGWIAVLKLGWGLRGLVLLTVGATLASIVGYCAAVKAFVPGVRFRWTYLKLDTIKQILGLGLYLQAYALVGVYYFYMGKAIVSFRFPLAAVAAFEVALRIPILLRQGILTVLGPVLPAVSHMEARGHSLQVKTLMGQAVRYSLILGAPAFWGVAVFAGPLVRLWVGGGFSNSILPLRILSIALGLSVFPDIFWFFLVGLGKQRIAVWFSLVQIAIGTALSYLLAREWGLSGVALGILATSLIGVIVFAMILLKQGILSFSDLPIGLAWKTSAMAAAAYLSVFACSTHFQATYSTFLLATAIASAVYLLGLLKEEYLALRNEATCASWFPDSFRLRARRKGESKQRRFAMDMSTNPQADRSYSLEGAERWALRIGGGVLLFSIFAIIVEMLNLPWLRISTLFWLCASACFLLLKVGPDFDLLHPVRLFGSLWSFCLALATMRLLPIISDWNVLMWSCVTIGLFSFVAGFGLGTGLWNREAEDQSARAEESFHKILLPNRRTLVLAALSIGVGTAVLGYEYHLLGTIPILADNIDQIRMELFGTAGTNDPTFDTLFIKSIHFLVEFIKYGVFLSFLVLIQRRTKNRAVTVLSALLVLVGTLVYISQAGRMFLIEILITCTVLYHYVRQRIRPTQLIAAGVIIFIVLGVAGSLRTQTSATGSIIDQVRAGSGFPDNRFWDGIGFGYLTLTESFEVFNRLTTDLQGVTKPANGFLFYNVHRVIPRSNLQEFALSLYSGLFVTPTYMGELYADFGIGGILVGSLILGLMYAWVYLQSKFPNPVFWVFVRGMFIQMVFFFPYVNLFSQYLNWIVDPIFMYLLICAVKPHVLQSAERVGAMQLPSEAI